jgi:hypothetical protein
LESQQKSTFKGGIIIFQNIISEMVQGNFSFLILIVGILQLIAMIKKNKKEEK